MLKYKEGINLNLSHVEANSDNYFRDISVVQLKREIKIAKKELEHFMD